MTIMWLMAINFHDAWFHQTDHNDSEKSAAWITINLPCEDTAWHAAIDVELTFHALNQCKKSNLEAAQLMEISMSKTDGYTLFRLSKY